VLLVGLIVGANRLGIRNYAILNLAIYGGFLLSAVMSLRACYRVVRTPEQSGGLTFISLMLAMEVFGLAARISDVFDTEDRGHIAVATDVLLLLALIFALQFLEALLRQVNSAILEDEQAGRGQQKPSIRSALPSLRLKDVALLLAVMIGPALFAVAVLTVALLTVAIFKTHLS
jgi:hypothetical protein